MADYSKTMYHMLANIRDYPGMRDFIGFGQYALLLGVLKQYDNQLKASQQKSIVKIKPILNKNNFIIVKGNKDD